MTDISRRDAIKFSAVSALGGVALGAALPRISGQSDVEKCIEAHKRAKIGLEDALAHRDNIENAFDEIEASRPLFRITPEGAPTRSLEMRVFTAEQVVDQMQEHYRNLRARIGYLPRQSQARILPQIETWEEDAFQRLDAYYIACHAEEDECGLTDARNKVEAADIAEDKAMLDLLASLPLTLEDAARKGDYLRETSWFSDAEHGILCCGHIEALFEGMGCGALS